MPDINKDKLLKDIINAILVIAGKDASVLTDFVKAEAEKLAAEAAKVTALYKAGSISKDVFEFAMADIAMSAKQLAAIVAGLGPVTVEKAWNATVKIIWDAVSGAIGFKLPIPIMK